MFQTSQTILCKMMMMVKICFKRSVLSNCFLPFTSAQFVEVRLQENRFEVARHTVMFSMKVAHLNKLPRHVVRNNTVRRRAICWGAGQFSNPFWVKQCVCMQLELSPHLLIDFLLVQTLIQSKLHFITPFSTKKTRWRQQLAACYPLMSGNTKDIK